MAASVFLLVTDIDSEYTGPEVKKIKISNEVLISTFKNKYSNHSITIPAGVFGVIKPMFDPKGCAFRQANGMFYRQAVYWDINKIPRMVVTDTGDFFLKGCICSINCYYHCA